MTPTPVPLFGMSEISVQLRNFKCITGTSIPFEVNCLDYPGLNVPSFISWEVVLGSLGVILGATLGAYIVLRLINALRKGVN